MLRSTKLTAADIACCGVAAKAPQVHSIPHVVHDMLLCFAQVNKIRECPQHPSLVVTHTDSPELFVWSTERQHNRQGDKVHEIATTGHALLASVMTACKTSLASMLELHNSMCTRRTDARALRSVYKVVQAHAVQVRLSPASFAAAG